MFCKLDFEKFVFLGLPERLNGKNIVVDKIGEHC